MMFVLGICGSCRSGKTTLANDLVNNFAGYKHYSIADTLKEACTKAYPDMKSEFGWNGTNWEGDKTTIGRQILIDWAHQARLSNENVFIDIIKTKIEEEKPEIAVISDIRHMNEIAWAVDENYGRMINILRESADIRYFNDLDTYYKSNKKECQYVVAQSELDWRVFLLYNKISDNFNMSAPVWRVENNGSFGDLSKKARLIDYYITLDINSNLGHREVL